ncbi:haloacid dehalogenase [Caballeronia choica]|uniref:Haloacid dehalogenase n=1 Tax=Caballeronia choica TaxID=326476 RepID=A0A158KFR0_9BURK|nr:haloacid dehalogenase type II [Caballeronia choica]SAL79271.1 haloacid dehalogenase [Caballeronia choica]
MALTDFKALTFDCYGTLVDWESGITSGLSELASRATVPLSRDEILEAHARHEAHQQKVTPAMPYDRLLQVVFKRLAEGWNVPYKWDEAVAYGASIGDWPAFPDSASTLQYLKKYFKLIVVSNVDNRSFRATNEKLAVHFDAIVTAEDVGSYKPSRNNFEYLFTTLSGMGISKGDTLHVADSVYHDHEPASEMGLRSCWIQRRYEQRGSGANLKYSVEPSVDYKFTSMAQLVKAHHEDLARE